MMTRCKDYEFIGRIPVTRGMGVEWEKDGEEYMTISSGFRDVSVHIDSWTSVGSIGAVHWYARFEVGHLDSVRLNGKEKGKIACIFCSELPKDADSFTIEVTKLMKKDEFGNNPSTGEIRLNAKKGSRYTGFLSREEAVEYAKKTYKRLFCEGGGFCGWRLTYSFGRKINSDYEVVEDE